MKVNKELTKYIFIFIIKYKYVGPVFRLMCFPLNDELDFDFEK